MLERIAGLPNMRSWITPAVLILLLVIAAQASESDLVATLRGKAWFEDEVGQGQTQGYYENLLDDSHTTSRKASGGAAVKVPPPPGEILFSEAGIVKESPTYLRWRMHSNLDTRWNGTVFRTNSLGYRTPEVESKKAEGTYRIVVIGSSNSMGQGVDDDAPYPRHLERWLNARVGPRRRVEVVNLAVSGDSPTRRLQRLCEDGGRFEADWILCDATVFDYFLEEAHLKAVLSQNIPIPFEFVHEALRKARITATDSPDAFQHKLRGGFEWLLDRAYAGWIAEARRLGAPMTVVILPRTDYSVASPRVFQLIRTLAKRHGLDYVDLSDAFRGLDEQRLNVSSWDHHPSALGQFAIFEAFRAELERRGELPGLALRTSAPRTPQAIGRSE